MVDILIADKVGNPKEWVSLDGATHYLASNKIIWQAGSVVKTYRGGYNAATGLRSTIDMLMRMFQGLGKGRRIRITDEDLAKVIQIGGVLKNKPLMPGSPQIKGADLDALVAYVRSLSAAK